MIRYRGPVEIFLRINGEDRRTVVRPADTLLWVLRENFGLTGAKAGCENGDCGACTVQRDGVPIKSCCTLAADVADSNITTIEGLRETPIQRAFLEETGLQCGFCTPGMVVNAEALVRTAPDADDETMREWLESNICRCTGYESIERSVKRALEATGDPDRQD